MEVEHFSFVEVSNDDVYIDLHVHPKAKSSQIVGVYNQRLKIQLTAAPVGGKTNEELRRLLAKTFNTNKSNVIVTRGTKSKHKRVLLRNVPSTFISTILMDIVSIQ